MRPDVSDNVRRARGHFVNAFRGMLDSRAAYRRIAGSCRARRVPDVDETGGHPDRLTD
jgi:hypothetical protein